MGDTRLFGNFILNNSGVYEDTLQNMNGCDSIIMLDLHVAQNLTRINMDEKVSVDYGSTGYLESEERGRSLIQSEWYENGIVIGDQKELSYLATEDNWIFFESVNELYCVSVDSVFIKTNINKEVFFPNAITPDGDGVNDLFNIGASETVIESQISIYDRWGTLIYTGPKTDERLIRTGWDGSYNGKPVQGGIYVYTAVVTYVDGEESVFKGELSVLR